MLTTTTVVAGRMTARGREVLLVDPAWEPDELESIADWLERERLLVVAGWATHGHYDHVLWHPRFGDAPRWSTPRAARYARDHQASLVAGLGPDWPADLASLVGAVTGLADDVIPWEGPRVRVLPHGAHCPGHAALWVEDARVLVAGDMLSDVEIPIPDREGVRGYLAGLRVMAPFASGAVALVPGHGHVAVAGSADAPAGRVEMDLRYLTGLGDHTDDPRLRDAPDWLLDQHDRNLSWVTQAR